MRLRTPTMDLLAKEFAEAVARGDTDRAEGWLAVAQLASSRHVPRPILRGWRSRLAGGPIVLRTP